MTRKGTEKNTTTVRPGRGRLFIRITVKAITVKQFGSETSGPNWRAYGDFIGY